MQSVSHGKAHRFGWVMLAIWFVFMSCCAAHAYSGAEAEPECSLLLNVPALEIRLEQDGTVVLTYPVAVGAAHSRTPLGTFRVVSKVVNPIWIPPDGSRPVMPGPLNPLGSRWMGLSLPLYGIHSTNTPSSVGQAVSRGCIRMLPEHAEQLFEIITVGTLVHIVYETIEVRLSRYHAEVYVYPDIYSMGEMSRQQVEQLLRDAGITDAHVDKMTDFVLEHLNTTEKVCEVVWFTDYTRPHDFCHPTDGTHTCDDLADDIALTVRNTG